MRVDDTRVLAVLSRIMSVPNFNHVPPPGATPAGNADSQSAFVSRMAYVISKVSGDEQSLDALVGALSAAQMAFADDRQPGFQSVSRPDDGGWGYVPPPPANSGWYYVPQPPANGGWDAPGQEDPQPDATK